jgi:hypothetical protein
MTRLDAEKSRLVRERVRQLADEHDVTDREMYLWLAYQALEQMQDGTCSEPRELQDFDWAKLDPHF